MYSRNETLRAMGRMMARYAQDNAGEMDADGVIETAPLMKPWQAGTMEAPVEYAKGDVRTQSGQPWKCSQAHTHHGEEGWDPVSSRALWAPYHARRADYALSYVQPTHAEDAYYIGEYMVYKDGKTYRCEANAVSLPPDELPAAWAVVE